MKLGCIQAALLMQARQAGLSSADGLRLEEHLSGCPSCRAEAGAIAGLSQLSSAGFAPLDPTARRRAIDAALAAGSGEPRKQRAVRSPLVWPLMAAGAAAALAAVLWLRAPAPQDPPQPSAAAAPTGDSRVLRGQVALSGTTRSAGQSLLAHAHMQTQDGALVQLAHASVELRPATQAAWDASQHLLSLSEGSVLVEVDPQPHQPFAVSTQHFVVHVLGTRFEVTPRSVRVLRGRVSVQPVAAGPATLLDASAGEREYRIPEPPAAAAAPRAPAVSPPSAASSGERRSGSDMDELLERARTQLATRALGEARRTLALALRLPATKAERAEALSLRAEAQLLAGRHAAARDGYLRVVETLPHEPAAETALYAAARIEAEHGDPARARALLARYRARYPHGSFVREAERREQALAERP